MRKFIKMGYVIDMNLYGDKCCNNCIYFYKINKYNSKGYCFCGLGNKDKQTYSFENCMNWISEEESKEPYLKEKWFTGLDIILGKEE